MASSMKQLRFSILRSLYWTPPRARSSRTYNRQWQRELSHTPYRGKAKRIENRESSPIAQVEDTAKELEQNQGNGTGSAQNSHAAVEAPVSKQRSRRKEKTEARAESAAEASLPGVQNQPPTEPMPTTEEIVEAVTRAMETPEGREEAAAVLEQVDAGTREAVVASILEKGSNEGFWKFAASNPQDEAFIRDNVTSMGHEELERQREYREYARLAAWELPLLSKLAKPFVPPTKEQVLRFRYTSYLGEEHPAASKVVVEFCMDDLPGLSQVQRNKLVKLLGVRYNPDTRCAKMSCDSFPSQTENRQWLAERVADLLAAARDPADTFEDVPFDFRHHKSKQFHDFPTEWILTEARRKELAARHSASLRLAAKKLDEARSLNEAKVKEDAVRRQAEMQTVPAQHAPSRDAYRNLY